MKIWYSQLPYLSIAECNVRRAGAALSKHADLARGVCVVADAIKILPIDVEVDIATARNDCNGVGLVLALFDKRG